MQLRVTAEQAATLRDHLIRDDRRERAGFLLAAESGEGLVTAETRPLNEDDMAVTENTACRPRPEVEQDVLRYCDSNDLHPVMVHSHPFTATAGFSQRDDRIMDRMTGYVNGLYPGMGVGFVVTATEETVFRWFPPADTGHEPVDGSITVIGDWLQPDTGLFRTPDHGPGDADGLDRDRFDRSIRCLGEDGQHRLAHTHVVVAGAGGLGSHITEQLARIGVGELTAVDPDVVEPSNLPRIAGAAPHHVGRPKPDVIREAVYRANPDTAFTEIQGRIQDHTSRIAAADLVVSTIDNATAKSTLNQDCVRHLTPFVDAGSRIDTERKGNGPEITAIKGLMQLVAPGVTAWFDCYGRGNTEQARIDDMTGDELDEEISQGYVDADVADSQPAITAINTAIAGATLQTVLKLVTRYTAPSALIRYDGLADDISGSQTIPNPSCVTCGPDGVLGLGESAPDPELDQSFDADAPSPFQTARVWKHWMDNAVLHALHSTHD
jgi:hypothetical protein